MKDEEYVFFSDSREKAITARSAHATRTHCGRGGKVRLPSDNLTKKELQKMNGEVKSYRLNDPMKWDEFKSMPDDLKVVYIQALRKKYNVPDKYIHEMFEIGKDTLIKEMKRLNLILGDRGRGRRAWDKEGFLAWANGVDMLPTPVIEEAPVEVPVIEEAPVHFYTEEERESFKVLGEVKGYAEDDLPFEEPDPIPVEEYKPIPQTAVPCNGSMSFKCPADQALNTLKQLLGSATCSISVMWRVVEEGSVDNG